MAAIHEELGNKLIVRPEVPFHFMRLKTLQKLITVSLDDITLARSENATMVIEVAKDIYDPIIYFPRNDIEMSHLSLIPGKSTHCPLKGDTEYFNLTINGKLLENAAWSYVKPLSFAKDLADLIAFDGNLVQIQM